MKYAPNATNRHVRSQQRQTRRLIRKTDAYAFFDLLTDATTLDQVESLLPVHRERLQPPTETLAMFMAQTLNADRSCQNAINEFSARRVSGGLSACSTTTGANCRASKRLPQSMVSSLQARLMRLAGISPLHLNRLAGLDLNQGKSEVIGMYFRPCGSIATTGLNIKQTGSTAPVRRADPCCAVLRGAQPLGVSARQSACRQVA